MIDKNIRIKPYFAVIAHTADLIELRAGVWNHVSYTIQDDTNSGLLYQFIKALDGSRSLYEIAKSLEMPRSEAEGIIDYLLQLNVLEDATSTAFDYFTDIYTPAFKFKQREFEATKNQKIYIISESTLADEIKKNLQDKALLANIEIIDAQHELYQLLSNNDSSWMHNALLFEEMILNFEVLKDGFIVMALENINPIFIKKFNRIATSLKIPWIHAAIDGPFIFIGPLFESQKTACYECFETRISMNLREYSSYQKYKSAIVENKVLKNSEFPMRGVLNSLMISHLTMEILNFALTGCSFTKNKVLSIYLPSMEITFNEFLKVSTCQNCGSFPQRDDHQLYFDVQGLLKEVQ
ncbi:MAG: TOMM precursor leader peptide-binding protein [Tatlockia sp.]|nr:TOMM precursor leader peptide-binding protein [Tatlockia sp.]